MESYRYDAAACLNDIADTAYDAVTEAHPDDGYLVGDFSVEAFNGVSDSPTYSARGPGMSYYPSTFSSTSVSITGPAVQVPQALVPWSNQNGAYDAMPESHGQPIPSQPAEWYEGSENSLNTLQQGGRRGYQTELDLRGREVVPDASSTSQRQACRHCGKTYVNRQIRNRHEQSKHTGPWFACDVPGCKTVVVRKDTLIKHKETHYKRTEDQRSPGTDNSV